MQRESVFLCDFQRAECFCRPLGCSEAKVKGWVDEWRMEKHSDEDYSYHEKLTGMLNCTLISTLSDGLTFELFQLFSCLIYCIYNRISAVVGKVLYSDIVFGCIPFNQGF